MRFAAVVVVLVFGSAVAFGQATQPASSGRLEARASEAFHRKDYAAALPMLRKVVEELKDRPAKIPAIQERIRICEAELAKLPPPAIGQPRVPHPAPVPGQTLQLSIKELGNFDYDVDKGGNIPADVRRLNGATVRLRGYMVPSDQIERITEFSLVPTLGACCFGRPPQIQHTIVCVCPPGKPVGYHPDEIVVEGILKVQELKDDGFITSIFQLDPATITGEAPKDAPSK